ncbi:hypothetical protein N7491_000808 [Penicillium cf. griseofulvum]|nr:hypothetical protein N7491_000808 [Penicillium cf. griseofulvum]
MISCNSGPVHSLWPMLQASPFEKGEPTLNDPPQTAATEMAWVASPHTPNDPRSPAEATETASAANPPRRPLQNQGDNCRTRAACPSPEPGLRGGVLVAAPVNSGPSRKRKRPLVGDQLVSQPASTKRKGKLFCGELGHEFAGLVSKVRSTAPNCRDYQQTTHQLLRCFPACGAVGVVWPKGGHWEGKGVFYPSNVNNTTTLELFAIACSLELAVWEIGETQPTDQAQTISTEVFVFSDHSDALKCISGDLPYFPRGDIANQVEVISGYSKTFHGLCVRGELHQSLGHCGVPSNEAADAMAKKAQRKLYRQPETFQLAVRSIHSIPTEEAPKSDHVALESCRARPASSTLPATTTSVPSSS